MEVLEKIFLLIEVILLFGITFYLGRTFGGLLFKKKRKNLKKSFFTSLFLGCLLTALAGIEHIVGTDKLTEPIEIITKANGNKLFMLQNIIWGSYGLTYLLGLLLPLKKESR